MATTINELLDELSASATSTSDKGTKLETLMQAFLQADPSFASQFSDVWLWSQWPDNGGKHDTGIDLVATDKLTGGTVAIQCKFFAPTTTISKPDIDSFLAASGKHPFAERIIVSTTDRWNCHAEDAIKDQQIPVRRIGVSDLESSAVDWADFSFTQADVLLLQPQKQLRPHQLAAIADVKAGFRTHDRGKLIMACGTGKTFTSLRLAEQIVGAGGRVLFLVPSISLLSQTFREWSAEAEVPLRSLAVCSDAKVTARSKNASEDIAAVDLPLPATTSVPKLTERLAAAEAELTSMTVVFATYQSIDVVAQAQKSGKVAPFDLIVCDEAHRTTGATIAGNDESAFVRVHNNAYLAGAKRLYMTATPRIYNDSSKAKAGEANAVLASMDDEAVYGPEFHRLGFGKAVEDGLLADYKVLVLAVDETAIARTFQLQLAEDGELRLDDAAKIVGCWNGLAKRGGAEHSFGADPAPMRRAVAFSGTIKDSKRVESLFGQTIDTYAAAQDLATADSNSGPVVACEIQHVDGSFNALERNTRLDWLRSEVADGSCRILTNARCLSEGVDVPALDAVMFLSPRKSVVDIVQSVGRVMRKAEGKQFGYIILPIGIPAGVTPEKALADNRRYAAVWEVLQALRAHDERFNAMVNRIELTSARDDKINVIGIPDPGERGEGGGDGSAQDQLGLTFNSLDEWRDAIYARIVAKVGSRKYWEQWAVDIADIAARHITRITALLNGDNARVTAEFDRFLSGLRGNLNDGISQADAIDMLAQHLITRPVFEALFGGYDFATHNPVAQSMEAMLAALDEHSLDNENESLAKFYDSVRMRVVGVDTAEGRQKLIVQLYDTFFATAFTKTVNKLGIVYTPVEIVDFILRSADEVLRAHFGQGLTDEGVHILDGFTGTGTFLVRLLQLGLISPHDLARKYANELHANEILLLAYYIAAVNIETTYQDVTSGSLAEASAYTPFPGLVLTDTFQSYEDGDQDDLGVFPDNNQRLNRQRGLPITVIVGNPPYSSGQDSANDNNANDHYPGLDAKIRDTYAARSKATNKNSLYDSYIRAIKWASLRIKDRGVIAFVTNGGWLDSNTADGLRLSLAEEFSDIWVYNLRGNQRTAGEQSRREGGKVFDAGSRATVAITVLVKDPAHSGAATIHYRDIGDYLSRESKLAAIAEAGSMDGLDAITITPNEHGDWLSQRNDDFGTYLAIGDKGGGPAVFGVYGAGLQTNRDAWVYQSSVKTLSSNLARHIAAYNAEVSRWQSSGRTGDDKAVQAWVDQDEEKLSWSRSLRGSLRRGLAGEFCPEQLTNALYRPFQRQHVYFDSLLNHERAQLPQLFPTAGHPNVGFYALNPGAEKPFSVLMVDEIPDLALYGSNAGQFFARWRYEALDADDCLFALGDPTSEVIDGYRRIDNITDTALIKFHAAYGASITKDDIFNYIYALLHSPDYRERYAADLKKMLPRIPLVSDPHPFIDAGRQLAKLHLGYETVACYPLAGLPEPTASDKGAYERYRVTKMAFAKQRVAGKLVADKTSIIYNSRITLSGIPEEAYRYQLGSRSAIEWIIDRYQIKTDKASGIINDPNDWAREVANPRYILDLLARIVTVSLATMQILDALPPLDVRADS